MANFEFEPKLIAVLREGLSREQLLRDVFSGLVVGAVALPLAIAFAIASGVRPEQGLFTAIVAGVLISAFSGSRVQIGGPTGAFVVIVAAVIERYGYDGLATATLMAGVLLIVLGLARLGSVVRYIPYPVTIGFTSGIGVIIAFGQVRDGLGLSVDAVPSSFLPKLGVLASHLDSLNPWALLMTIATILTVRLSARLTTRVPGMLVALVAITAIARVLHLPVETIGSRFGSIPTSLPSPHLPNIQWGLLAELSGPALSIALLCGIESLLSAVVADGMTGRRHRSNMELVAQGVANLASPLFLGIPATGAIARTATNVNNGGRTPIAGIVHALTLLLILSFLGSWAELIPMPVLAGILILVAWKMSEAHLLVRLARSGPGSDTLVLLATFLLTVLVDLTVAIQVGMVLAAFLFMRRITEVSDVKMLTGKFAASEEDSEAEAESRRLPEGVEVFEINGAFCFGAAEKFSEAISAIRKPPRVVILRMRHVLAMDATGLRALEEVAARFRRSGSELLLSGLHAQPLVVLEKSGLADELGRDRLFDDFDAAAAHAQALVDGKAPDHRAP